MLSQIRLLAGHQREFSIGSLLTTGQSLPESTQVQSASILRETPSDEHFSNRQNARFE